MKIDAVRAHEFAPVVQEYSRKDTILYALGLGFGADPASESHLQFLFEERLQAVPTMSMVLGHTGFWARNPEFEIDWVKLLHAEQSLEMVRALAPEGKIVARNRIVGISDKGPGKGALVHQRREIHDVRSDELIARIGMTLFLRGDGGCGSFGEQVVSAPELPDRAPERTLSIQTLPQAALIYRLSGDWNPIHADPATARKAGFERPILHGLCSMGVACRALIEAYADDDPSRVKYISVRFSKPVFPGETLAVDFYREGGHVRFRARVVERDIVVLDRGVAAVEDVAR
jgi:acyl dehydratase